MTDTKEEPFLKPEEDYWENLDVNDCSFLLRTLEREAYTAVVNALRAKGPPSEHTFLLLDHLKSALSINDELGRAEIRRAAFDPKLCKLSKVLNPNYDTCTEWEGCSSESRGFVEAGPSRAKPFASTSSSSVADQLLNLATTRNEKVNRLKGRSIELISLPHKPFVPECLRLLLRETERAEQRIAPPLETPSQSPVVRRRERKSRSEGRPPPMKKRRQRMSKGKKELPPELRKEKSPKIEEEVSIHPCISVIPSSSTAVPPLTPFPISAAAISSVNMESVGSIIISPGRPPQSGDAMRTWVSKIHEKEVAASAAKKNGVVASPDDMSEPSTSYANSDDSAKKKRRSRTTFEDPCANSCARTRPFIFVKADKGCEKPERGNPDKRFSTKPAPPIAFGPSSCVSAVLGDSIPSGSLPSTPIARPEILAGVGNGLLTESPSSSISTPSSIVGNVSGGGKGSTSISVQARKGQVTPNNVRTPGRYFVNNSGATSSSSSSHTVKIAGGGGGMGGRTASLGSQQLTSMDGIPGRSLFAHNATPSKSNSCIGSTNGGTTGSGIGAGSSSSSSHPGSSLPLEIVGHDYTCASADASKAVTLPKGDHTAQLRQSPKIVPRVRMANVQSSVNPPLGSPSHTPSHQYFPPLNGLTPSVVPLHATPSATSTAALHRAASMSTFRARSGSRGAASAASAGVASMGERMGTNLNEPVTDGMVQATVHNIMLEAAQKECANGKRATVLMRENGLLNRHSPMAGPSSQPVQHVQHHPSYLVGRPSAYSDEATSSSTPISGLTRDPVPPVPPAPPSFNKTPLLTALTASAPPLTTGYAPTPSQPPSSLSGSSMDTSRARGGMDSSLFLGGGGGSSISSSSFPQFPCPTPDEMRRLLLSLDPSVIGEEQKQQLINNLNEMKAKAIIIPDPLPPSSVAQAGVVNAAAATVPLRPSQRQYRLQPDTMSYTEFNADNPQSYKSFALDGTPVQYSVSREELYDQGVLPRPISSTMGGVDGGMRGNMEIKRTPQPQASSHSILQQQTHQAAATAAAQLGVPSSFSITAISGTGGMLSNSREERSYVRVERDDQRSIDGPPGVEKTSNEGKDILEQSCMELR